MHSVVRQISAREALEFLREAFSLPDDLSADFEKHVSRSNQFPFVPPLHLLVERTGLSRELLRSDFDFDEADQERSLTNLVTTLFGDHRAFEKLLFYYSLTGTLEGNPAVLLRTSDILEFLLHGYGIAYAGGYSPFDPGFGDFVFFDCVSRTLSVFEHPGIMYRCLVP